ncbi:MAG: hypothetical protein MRY72_08610 [Aquisalinus sp.]|nr:hypothetical protein [Aquisalinus sp.]
MLVSIMVAIAALIVSENETGIEEEASLEELCAQYESLSDKLTQDYAAIQQATLQAKQEENLLPEIKANATYTRTRIAFKEVVAELGTRTCPIDLDRDFPPLVE